MNWTLLCCILILYLFNYFWCSRIFSMLVYLSHSVLLVISSVLAVINSLLTNDTTGCSCDILENILHIAMI